MRNVFQSRCGQFSAFLKGIKLVALTVPLFLSLHAMAGGDGIVTGTFEGSGRACYGKLKITSKTISWSTSFSSCRNLKYEIIEQSNEEGKQRVTYAMKTPNKGCLYSVILLNHSDKSKPDLDWGVTGYLSLEDYKTNNTQNSMSCSLVQLK